MISYRMKIDLNVGDNVAQSMLASLFNYFKKKLQDSNSRFDYSVKQKLLVLFESAMAGSSSTKDHFRGEEGYLNCFEVLNQKVDQLDLIQNIVKIIETMVKEIEHGSIKEWIFLIDEEDIDFKIHTGDKNQRWGKKFLQEYKQFLENPKDLEIKFQEVK